MANISVLGLLIKIVPHIEQLEYVMSTKQAIAFNKKDSTKFDCFRWKKGDKSTRFWTIEDLYKAATEYVQEHFKNCRLLIRSCGATLDPSEIIWCANEDIKKELVRIYEAHDAYFEKSNNPHRRWPKEVEALEDEWWVWIEKLYTSSC